MKGLKSNCIYYSWNNFICNFKKVSPFCKFCKFKSKNQIIKIVVSLKYMKYSALFLGDIKIIFFTKFTNVSLKIKVYSL